MRHFVVRVPRGQGDKVVEAANEHESVHATLWEVRDSDNREIDMVSIQMENRSVGPMFKALESIDDVSATLFPHEVLDFVPPASKAPKAVKNLENRSPLEVFLLSVQSMGSWGSFLAYTIAGAIIVWISFFTNSVYLLIAAMLIAPFAGPAMNVALSTSVGDKTLFWQSLARYSAAVLVTAVTGAALSLIFRQRVVTDLMTGVGYVSNVAIILPLAAGAAGALNLVQSERSSLVPGAAVGMLVTVSLAPPAGLIGTAAALREWLLVMNAVFLLLLQLVAINLSGALTFRHYGLTSSLARYQRGQQWIYYTSLALSVAMIAGLLVWQFSGPIRFQRSSESTRASETIRALLRDSDMAHLVEVQARFQTSENYGSDTLLVDVYAERTRDAIYTAQAIEEELTENIQRELQLNMPKVIPLVNVTILQPPPFTPTVTPASSSNSN